MIRLEEEEEEEEEKKKEKEKRKRKKEQKNCRKTRRRRARVGMGQRRKTALRGWQKVNSTLDRDKTRTCNPQIRSLMPSPLGHTAPTSGLETEPEQLRS